MSTKQTRHTCGVCGAKRVESKMQPIFRRYRQRPLWRCLDGNCKSVHLLQ